MVSSTKGKHAIFIERLVETGIADGEHIAEAYMIAYPKCKKREAARASGYKLLQNATVKAAIDQGLAEKQNIIAEARKKQIQEVAAEKIISQTEVDAVLSEIILGNRMNKKKAVVFNRNTSKYEVVSYEEPPSAGEVIAAIDKYNKRYGSNAAKKVMDVTPDTVLVPGEDDN